jgi:hypothetical protein
MGDTLYSSSCINTANLLLTGVWRLDPTRKACTDLDSNVAIAQETLENFYFNLQQELEKQGAMRPWKDRKTAIYRSLYAAGVLCRHFDFEEPEAAAESADRGLLDGDEDDDDDPELRVDVIPHVVYNVLRKFVDLFDDKEAKRRALQGLGHLFVKHPALMIRQDMLAVYRHWLSPDVDDQAQWAKQAGEILRLQVGLFHLHMPNLYTHTLTCHLPTLNRSCRI